MPSLEHLLRCARCSPGDPHQKPSAPVLSSSRPLLPPSPRPPHRACNPKSLPSFSLFFLLPPPVAAALPSATRGIAGGGLSEAGGMFRTYVLFSSVLFSSVMFWRPRYAGWAGREVSSEHLTTPTCRVGNKSGECSGLSQALLLCARSACTWTGLLSAARGKEKCFHREVSWGAKNKPAPKQSPKASGDCFGAGLFWALGRPRPSCIPGVRAHRPPGVRAHQCSELRPATATTRAAEGGSKSFDSRSPRLEVRTSAISRRNYVWQSWVPKRPAEAHIEEKPPMIESRVAP